MIFPVALQLYSVREDMAKDFTGTLRTIKAQGYDGVEFAGLYDHKPADIKTLLEDIGLVPISAHVPLEALMAAPEKAIGDYAEIGCKYVAIPYLVQEYRPGAEKFEKMIKEVINIGKIARANGMTLLYHNHDFEFAKINGEYALDVIYKSVSPDLLQTEIDTCWVNVGGENPSDYLRKYAGRSPVVHLKDFVMPGKKPEKMYDLIGIEDDRKIDETKAFEFRPLGKGVQNFTEILKACGEVGAKWLVVEQDAPSMDKTPLECAEISVQYLKTL